METWGAFKAEAPVLAALGRERLRGRVAYLATRRRDGSPRVHPVTPIVSDERLFLFMEPTSPKRHDLLRDARYALHCGVGDNSGGGGEFFVTGTAEPVADAQLREQAMEAASYQTAARYVLFHLLVVRAESRTYEDMAVRREVWPS
jgi:hypothetical protein